MDGADETAELFSGSEDGPPEDTVESAAVVAASDNEEDVGAEEEVGDGEESRSQSPKAFGTRQPIGRDQTHSKYVRGNLMVVLKIVVVLK